MRLIDADTLPKYDGTALSAVEVARAVEDAPEVSLKPHVHFDYDAIREEIEKKMTHGHWIVVLAKEWCTFDECKCSVCGAVEYFQKGWKKYNYCPNCGAKMEGGEDDADE